mmetsp:Transcript_14647/g.25531  ORF Transcript_14647/g.25531 Transcript_14647/m.25531 type:complete len:114 (-) Transcript_14647:627-968(-)|eukprot:CAMPEP_0119116896 /NCGR_PEP_ID=MMETSP1180-20130426/52537_1 /TAXON_ID=3052 ORGANISM="Chlamydomonas cf sp, Strain CCMP681" /NCGR_SAMPLE_ID=MMETSP1180 /ASSEMBLY_ACC=CAM_ASM_000741 /LENGTH=113 /DNA_ID=CAMNT_0007106095 /DNA_START=78 /DNA_END=419 /DNA_ORIENTATION=+
MSDGGGLPSWGSLDISLKIGIGLAGATAAAAAITLPNKREKERAALDLFDRPWTRLTPQETKVAEFSAGYKRWNDFFQQKVYPITRKLPGSQTPLLNPYGTHEPMGGNGDEDD